MADPVEKRPRFRLLRRLLPLAALLAVGIWYFRGAPREVTLVFDLGAKRDGLTSMSVEIVRLPERTLARHVEMLYSPSNPAPARQASPSRLPPGEYEANIALAFGGGRVEQQQRRFALDQQDQVDLTP